MLFRSLALAPLGVDAPSVVALVGFALGGLFWAPYVPILTAMFQKEASPAVMAARGAFGMASTPFGALVGGPLVAVLGAQATLLMCAVGTMALALVAAAIVLARRNRVAEPRPVTEPPTTHPTVPSRSPANP